MFPETPEVFCKLSHYPTAAEDGDMNLLDMFVFYDVKIDYIIQNYSF